MNFSGFCDPFTQIPWTQYTARYDADTHTVRLGYPTCDQKTLQKALAKHLQSATPPNLLTSISPKQVQSGLSRIPNIANIIGIAANKGGVGKSTLAFLLAKALRQLGAKVGLLDGDLYGPNQPQLAGSETKALTSEQGYQPVMTQGVALMSMGFLVEAQTPLAWRGPMASAYFMQMLEKTLWPSLDYLLIDLPPGTGDIMLTLAKKVPVSGMLVVTTPQELAIADMQKGMALIDKMHLPMLGLIENMAGYHCPSCNTVSHLTPEGRASQLATHYAIPYLGSLPLHSALSEIQKTHEESHEKEIFLEENITPCAIKLASILANRPPAPRGHFGNIVKE